MVVGTPRHLLLRLGGLLRTHDHAWHRRAPSVVPHQSRTHRRRRSGALRRGVANPQHDGKLQHDGTSAIGHTSRHSHCRDCVRRPPANVLGTDTSLSLSALRADDDGDDALGRPQLCVPTCRSGYLLALRFLRYQQRGRIRRYGPRRRGRAAVTLVLAARACIHRHLWCGDSGRTNLRCSDHA